ncbi:MAG: LuxR family transcriptional regulator [Rhodobacteraceae bacterium]|nr:LuxR family transcriptional regulator [Alphaproteobacteria bacterium]NNF71024.1 LuxR family transcriptional regulator [Paracoccaceae bacterium]NNK67073.1 LuxR family transcriptional regulator [Paracoccaceae bacterium]
MLQVKTLDELSVEITALRDSLDVENLVYHSVNSTGEQYAALTYSEKWVTRYLQEDYARIDPVVQSCYQRFDPVDWQQLDWSGKAVRSFLGEAQDEGIGNQGLSIPIRGPSGQFALFTVNQRGNNDQWAHYVNENLADLLLAAHYINRKALEIERGDEEVARLHLSPREADTLKMLALGYSRAKAAELLSISEHTLLVYIENARVKLGASNTTNAVARAVIGGLIVV